MDKLEVATISTGCAARMSAGDETSLQEMVLSVDQLRSEGRCHAYVALLCAERLPAGLIAGVACSLPDWLRPALVDVSQDFWVLSGGLRGLKGIKHGGTCSPCSGRDGRVKVAQTSASRQQRHRNWFF